VDPRTDQLGLSGDTEPPVGGAGGHQHRVGADALTAGEAEHGVVAVGVEAFDGHGRQHLDSVPARLGHEPLRQLRTPDALGEARVVVHALRHARLATQGTAVDHQGADPLPRGVDGGGEARRTSAHDGQVVGGAVRLQLESQPRGQLGVGGLEEMVALLEDDGGDRPAPLLQLLDEAQALRIIVDVDPPEGDAVLGEEPLRPLAVGAPRSPVDGDPGHPQLPLNPAARPESCPQCAPRGPRDRRATRRAAASRGDRTGCRDCAGRRCRRLLSESAGPGLGPRRMGGGESV